MAEDTPTNLEEVTADVPDEPEVAQPSRRKSLKDHAVGFIEIAGAKASPHLKAADEKLKAAAEMAAPHVKNAAEIAAKATSQAKEATIASVFQASNWLFGPEEAADTEKYNWIGLERVHVPFKQSFLVVKGSKGIICL